MQYLILFLSSFLAATVIPFSSEAHLLYLLSQDYNPYLLLLSCSTGNTLGGITSFYLGYFCKWRWLEKYLRIQRSKVESYQLAINKYGSWLALFCWLPFVGDVIAVALGLFRLKWQKIFFLMFLGKAVRYSLMLLI